MEPFMQSDDDDGRVRVQLPADLQFEQKWDVLKPVIEQLYLEQDRKLTDVMEMVKAEYGFVASESSYKYHVARKWKLKKNLSTSQKAALCAIRRTRAAAGKTTIFRNQRQGKDVEERKLRRHLKDEMRRDIVSRRTTPARPEEFRILSGSSFLLSNSIFLNWNMPYGTMQLIVQSPGIPAPSPMSISTPSDVVVVTPASDNVLSTNNAPSPISRVQNMKATVDRAHMFVEGRFRELLLSMQNEEKILMSKWLYQFWIYGFKTAKSWGRGPRNWDAESLRLNVFPAISPAPTSSTPRPEVEATNDERDFPERDNPITLEPSPLCHWSIHYPDTDLYHSCRSRTPTPDRSPTPDPSPYPLEEASWMPWPSSWQEPSYQTILLDSLATNDFSNIKAKDLPIAVPQIVKAAEAQGDELLEEAYGFAIMARNTELLLEFDDRLGDTEDETAKEKVGNLNPVHFATTYLNGSDACCTVLRAILFARNVDLRFRPSSLNNLGHTAFDNLLLGILKAHTSITPGAVDGSLRDEKRFPGEEIDICGRWDADSNCIQALLAACNPRVPFTWKHKFCHTSAKTICHCLDELCRYAKSIGEVKGIAQIPSGLFVKHCVSCGLKMELLPLHNIVLVTFALAQFGKEDEDLFGMLAVLLAMLREGADPRETADFSISALFHGDEVNMLNEMECDHAKLKPAELADRVPSSFVENWSKMARTGWEIFRHILRRSESQWQTGQMPSSCEDIRYKSDDDGPTCQGPRVHYFGGDTGLAVLSAAVETELLTYRRLKEGDPWISPHFNLDSLLEGLNDDGRISIGLVEKEMMKRVCDCGRFLDGYRHLRGEQAMRYDFSNLDDWSRTTFLSY